MYYNHSNGPGVKAYLEQLHRRFFILAIEKSSNNLLFIICTSIICEKYCITKLLFVVGLKGSKPSEIYSQSTINKEEIVDANITNYKKKNAEAAETPLEVFLGKGDLQLY